LSQEKKQNCRGYQDQADDEARRFHVLPLERIRQTAPGGVMRLN
jgi:hypothetical protein